MERLLPSLKVMGFVDDDIKVHKDEKFEDMMKIMEAVSNDNYTDYDCLMCVIISHGLYDYIEEGTSDATKQHFIADVIFGTDKPGSLNLLMEKMQSCETLKGKPKIFIVDACRGYQRSKPVVKVADAGKEAAETCLGSATISSGQSVGQGESSRGRVIDHYQHGYYTGTWYSPFSEFFPIWKDYLLIYSTQPGFEAFGPGEGTPFMKAFHDHVMERKGTEISFLKLLTRVNKSVAQFEWQDDVTKKIWKQMPWVASRLTKLIVLSLKNNNEHTQI